MVNPLTCPDHGEFEGGGASAVRGEEGGPWLVQVMRGTVSWIKSFARRWRTDLYEELDGEGVEMMNFDVGGDGDGGTEGRKGGDGGGAGFYRGGQGSETRHADTANDT